MLRSSEQFLLNFSEWYQSLFGDNYEILWTPNSMGWTAVHIAASHRMPLPTWEWIVSIAASISQENFLTSLTCTGQSVVELFFRTYMCPLIWQDHAVRREAKVLTRALNNVRMSNEQLQLFQQRILKNFQLKPPRNDGDNCVTDIDRCSMLWRYLDPLYNAIGDTNEPTLAFLARTGCCPVHLAKLAVALEASKNPHDSDLPGRVLHAWAIARSFNDLDGMLEPLLDAFPGSLLVLHEPSSRNPCHEALLSGKGLNDIKLLLKRSPSLVNVPDPVTRLPWAGLMALGTQQSTLTRALQGHHAKVSMLASVFKDLPTTYQKDKIQQAQDDLDCEKLTAIFWVIRFSPSAINFWQIQKLGSP